MYSSVIMQGQKFYVCLIFLLLHSLCESFEQRGNKTEVYVVRYLEGGRIIPVTVFLNFDQQTELVITAKKGRKSKTFYDFIQGHVAYKDDNSSHCFIEKLVRDSLQADSDRLKKLQNGVVREFYVPTFNIEEDSYDGSEVLQKFGSRIADFCNGSTVAVVRKEEQMHRRKRDTSATFGDGEKGQFTHHSYGHYGHQSNNYAHYGHETHVIGTVDKDGNIRNQRMQQHQMRSEGSQSMPVQGAPNDFQSRSDDQRFHQTNPMHGRPLTRGQNNFNLAGNEFGRQSGGQFSLQTDQESGYQLNLPLGIRAGNAYRGGIRSQGQYGVGGMQPQISSEFQRYPTGPGISDTAKIDGMPVPPDQRVIRPPTQPKPILPGVQYTNGRAQEPRQPGLHFDERGRSIITRADSGRRYDEHGRPVAAGVLNEHRYDAYGRPIIADAIPGRRYDDHGRPTDSNTFPGRRYDEYGRPTAVDAVPGRRYDAHGRSIDADAFPGRRYDAYGRPITADAIPGRRYDEHGSIIAVGTVPGRDYDGRGRPITKDGTLGSTGGDQISSSAQRPMPPGMRQVPGHPASAHSGFHDSFPAGISPVTDEPNDFVRQHPSSTFPGSSASQESVHERYRPSQLIDGRTYVPGYMPGVQLGGTPGSIPTSQGMYEHHFRPSSMPIETPSGAPSTFSQRIPGQQIRSDLISPDSRQRQVSRRVLPDSRVITSPESAQQTTRQQYQPSIPSEAQERQYAARDFRSPTNIRTPYLQTANGIDDSSRISSARVPGRTIDSVGTQLDSVYGTGFPSRLVDSRGREEAMQSGSVGTDALGAGWRGTAEVPSRTGFHQISGGTSVDGKDSQFGVRSKDSASSQTQIQSGFEGTAAEASAAGNYRGLGSKTQVQGGYTGNGSFSAQAQSGFTGGLTQSQIQGGKRGGSSGSSAQVERVGAAQSQVQIGQPSGSASSSAQGRFSSGTTQVQAQSGKTGGSARAQAQSRGLSNSQAQVNIGGGDSQHQNGFQGTVSASVQGGLSSAQSQTQLQGGYESGRTYSATAQGGFDAMSAFQGSVPAAGSLVSQTRLPSILPQAQRTDFPGIRTTDRHYPTGVNDRGIHGVSSGSFPRVTESRLPGINEFIAPNVTRPTEVRVGDTFPSGYDSFQPGYPPHLIPPDGLPDIASARRVAGIPGTLPGSPEIPGAMSSVPSMPEAQPRIPGTPTLIPGELHGIPGLPGLSTSTQGMPSSLRISGTLPAAPAPLSSIPSIQQVPGLPSIPGMTSMSRIPGTLPGLPAAQFGVPRIQGAPGTFSGSPGIPEGISVPGMTGIPRTLSGVHGIPGTLAGTPRMSSTIPGIPGSFSGIPGRPETSADTLPSMPGFQPNILSQQFPNYHVPIQLPIHSTYPGSEHQAGFPATGRQPGLMIPSGHVPSQTYPVSLKPDGTSAILQPPAVSRPGARTVDTSNIFQTSLPGPQGSLPDTALQPMMPAQLQISPPEPTSPDSLHQGQAILQSRTSGPVQQPGPREPDGKDCCEALKNLKQRCCGSSPSSCCTNGVGNSDFGLNDDLDESNGENSCRIVKAICYIVYKPIGKARICKPTKTNGC